jgi:hypothetical protein
LESLGIPFTVLSWFLQAHYSIKAKQDLNNNIYPSVSKFSVERGAASVVNSFFLPPKISRFLLFLAPMKQKSLSVKFLQSTTQ